MRFVATVVCVALAACSTPYQEMGFAGGVSAQQLTEDTYRIVARGNGYTDRTAIQDYTVLKAAETTKKAGGTHFAIISANDASRTHTVVDPGSAQTTYGGGMAFTTYSPATVSQYIKPGTDTYIRVVTVPPGKAAAPGLISADEIIRFVGPRVPRPYTQKDKA